MNKPTNSEGSNRNYSARLIDYYKTILLKATRDGRYNLVEEMHEIDSIASEIHKGLVNLLMSKSGMIPVDVSEEILDYTRRFKVDMGDAHHKSIQGNRRGVLDILSKYKNFIEEQSIDKKRGSIAGLFGQREPVCKLQYIPDDGTIEVRLIEFILE